MAQVVDAERAYVTILHADGTLENSHEWIRSGVVPQRPAIERLHSGDFAASVDLAVRGEVFAAPDLSALPEEFDAEKGSFSSFGVKAVLQVPFAVGPVGRGLIGFNYFRTVGPWSGELIAVLRRVGTLIGGMLFREFTAAGVRLAFEQAERANRARDGLLRELRHELRTPLHAILGYAELLELDLRSDTERSALAEIQQSGRHLLTMVEDLLSLASDDPDDVDVIELEPLVGDMFDTLARAADGRSVELSTGRGLAGATVRSEPGRIRQLLYCLLSGAVQAVDAFGSVTIDVVETGSEPWIQLHLTSLEDSSTADDVVTPLGRLLAEPYGKIDIVEHADGSVDIDVRLGQGANP